MNQKIRTTAPQLSASADPWRACSAKINSRVKGNPIPLRSTLTLLSFWAYAGASDHRLSAMAFGLPMLAAAAWWT